MKRIFIINFHIWNEIEKIIKKPMNKPMNKLANRRIMWYNTWVNSLKTQRKRLYEY